MNVFTASIKYEPDVTMKLSLMQQKVFRRKERLTGYIVSLFLIGTAFYLGLEQTFSMISLVVGCLMFANVDATARYQARKTVSALKGYVPKMDYEFRDDGFTGRTENESHDYKYSSIERMAEDKKFLYLFPNGRSAFMIDRKSIKGGKAEKLKEFLEDKTGIGFIRNISLIHDGPKTVVESILYNRKYTSRSSGPQGPHL